MSYLTLAAGIPDFSKAVISLWFRVPGESVVAAAGHSLETEVEGFSMLQSILPLVTFGQPQVNKNYVPQTHDVANWIGPVIDPPPHQELYYEDAQDYEVDPCLIGIQPTPDGFRMIFNIQMGDYMSLSSADWITTQMNLWTGDDPSAPTDLSPGSGYVAIGLNVGQAIIEDASYINNAQPEFFFVSSDNQLEPDKWHHLLLSFDVGGSVAIGHPFASSDCRMWYAIDDVDYRGAENLQPWRDSTDGLDPNAILTNNAYRRSGVDTADPFSYLYQNHPVPLLSGSYSPAPIPSSGAPLSLPASSRYVDGIFRCEMAEFQMWTGVTLDTGDVNNRRAFVDENGKPVDPTEGTVDEETQELDPRGPGERLLGKKPEILLHGNSKWKQGYNTGTLGITTETGVDEHGNVTETVTKIPSGQFTPTALIEKYKPEPALEPETA